MKRASNKKHITKTSFKPGQSGNILGRPPKDMALSDILKDLICQGTPERRQVIANKLVDLAEKGDLNAIKLVFERVDGKAKEYIESHSTFDIDQNYIIETLKRIKGGHHE